MPGSSNGTGIVVCAGITGAFCSASLESSDAVSAGANSPPIPPGLPLAPPPSSERNWKLNFLRWCRLVARKSDCRLNLSAKRDDGRFAQRVSQVAWQIGH
jgi:hypothetical protein